MQSKNFDVIIIGAGASGLMCCLEALNKGRRVLLLDHAKRIGRKLAITGGGKGNFTNLSMGSEYYFGNNPYFTRSALSRFTPYDLLSLFEEMNIPYEEREHGQMFCLRTAEDIVDYFYKKCTQAKIFLQISIKKIIKKNKFIVTTNQGTFTSPSLVMATGNIAWPQVGAGDFGLRIAKQFGHAVILPKPALSGFIMPESWSLSGIAGISLPVNITVEMLSKHYSQCNPVAESLSLLFTHKGISGPAALQASLYWEKGFPLTIDFLPKENIINVLTCSVNGKLFLKNLLKKFFPERMVQKLVPSFLLEKKVAEISSSLRKEISHSIKNYTIIPTSTEGFKKAEVAKGGVDTSFISSKTMESTCVAGLFFCGELLDITGRLGGYNLHWAFASGKAAGEYV